MPQPTAMNVVETAPARTQPFALHKGEEIFGKGIAEIPMIFKKLHI